MGKTVRGKEREMILKVMKYFEHEKSVQKFLVPIDPKAKKKESEHSKINEKFLIPPDQVVNRTCAATGISKSLLMRIKREAKTALSKTKEGPSASGEIPKLETPGKKRRPSSKKIEPDGFDLCALRNIVNSFYLRKELPTSKKILDAAKSKLHFPGEKVTLRRILREYLGYSFKKCKNGLILLQKPNLAAWRARYLRRILQNKNLGAAKKPVTYIDETIIYSNYTERKCWKSRSATNDTNLGQRWILIHAGGNDGFIPEAALYFQTKSASGNYNCEMDDGTFTNWLTERLLPNLPPSGIVVIDNAPYHMKKSEKQPTSSAQKEDMQRWLQDHSVPFDPNMAKAELYHLIVINKPEKKYVVDEFFKMHGHEVLRLPPYHCDLNPLQYIWNLVKQRVAEQIINESEGDMDKFISKALASITKEEWKKEVKKVESQAKKYWEEDSKKEINERELIISLGDELSGSESEKDEEPLTKMEVVYSSSDSEED